MHAAIGAGRRPRRARRHRQEAVAGGGDRLRGAHRTQKRARCGAHHTALARASRALVCCCEASTLQLSCAGGGRASVGVKQTLAWVLKPENVATAAMAEKSEDERIVAWIHHSASCRVREKPNPLLTVQEGRQRRPGVVVELGCTTPARGATTRASHQLSLTAPLFFLLFQLLLSPPRRCRRRPPSPLPTMFGTPLLSAAARRSSLPPQPQLDSTARSVDSARRRGTTHRWACRSTRFCRRASMRPPRSPLRAQVKTNALDIARVGLVGRDQRGKIHCWVFGVKTSGATENRARKHPSGTRTVIRLAHHYHICTDQCSDASIIIQAAVWTRGCPRGSTALIPCCM